MKLVELLSSVTNNAGLITFLISMVPVVELRGAIPVGVSLGMSHLGALAVSILGNMVPVPFIILFIRKIFQWLRRHMPRLEGLISKLERRAEAKREMVHRWKFWGLLLLVAIPLPGTGAWTGALVAAFMDMRMRDAFPAILGGVIVAGIIVVTVTFGVSSLVP